MNKGLIQIFIGLGLFIPECLHAQTTTRPTAPPQTISVAAFNVIAEPGHEWIGKAVSEGLTSELERGGLKIADGSGTADWTVTGSIQVVEDQLKIDAKMTHVGDGAIKSLTAQGKQRELFDMESTLGQKAVRVATPAGRKMVAAPVLELAAPPMVHPSTYFDGDIAVALSVPENFTAERDRYNLQPTPFDLIEAYGNFGGCTGGGCGFGSGGCGFTTPSAGGGAIAPRGLGLPQANVSSW